MLSFASGAEMTDIAVQLTEALGEDVVTPGEAVDKRYWCDWSAVDPTQPKALIRPRSTAEVATALRLCHAAGQFIVPQGGLTGLAGGATPRAGNIALSLERLSGIEEIDVAAATMTLGAGTILETAQRAADDAGFLLALDLGARGSCQIGGNLSTNAGGNRVIRYGMAREQVLGLEVVLADGQIVTSLNKMLKNNAGYDIKQIFVGAEGTLGIITRAILRLHPKPLSQSTAFCALADYAAVVALLRRAQSELGGISAFEVMWHDFYDFVANHPTIKQKPLADKFPFYVLIEQSGSDPQSDTVRFESVLAKAMADGAILDAVVAQSEQAARDFWLIREGHAIDTMPLVINFDVSLPIGEIDRFAVSCRAALQARWPKSLNVFYGHIGDSNLHVSVMISNQGAEVMHAVDDVVYGAVRQMAGSVSAEHGVGTLKRSYLSYSRSAAELAVMRQLKQALDPKGILNPGKLL
jgi:FAD/FMN-containing dehydrogenase